MAAIDPVCQMRVDEGKAAATYQYAGQNYHFCAEGCRDRFAENPEMFLNGRSVAEASQRSLAVPKTPLKEEDLKQIDLPIRGMSCASCVERVETGLSKLEGIKESVSAQVKDRRR
jgi:Cu+-exporting ATPase